MQSKIHIVLQYDSEIKRNSHNPTGRTKTASLHCRVNVPLEQHLGRASVLLFFSHSHRTRERKRERDDPAGELKYK